MSLVLQMPRGNLETISPRALVMEVVRQDLDTWVLDSIVLMISTENSCPLISGNFRKAFLSCRKHRIDLNFLVDHNQTAFLERLSSFVEQLDDVDHINLFLTNLGYVTFFLST